VIPKLDRDAANNRKKSPIILVVLLITLLSFLSFCKLSLSTVHYNYEIFDYQTLVSKISLENIKAHVSYLSNLGSLVPGYFGNIEASQYIYDKFSKFGLLNVSYDEFNLTIPIDYGAHLTILSRNGENKSIPLYIFWPNVVALGKTPADGIVGKLVYIGDGSLREMDGKPINGNIILMNINSQYNWINAAKFGAKAVIFVQSQTTRQELAMKVLSVPFNFPRLLIKEDDANYLLYLLEKEQNLTVKLNADMKWETRIVRNIMGYIKGTMYPDKFFLITSRYDSFSYVPALNPAAQDSISPAVLLEIARFFANNPPKYSAIFVAFAGTYFNLAGSRHFVKKYMIERYDTFGKNVVMILNFDINAYGKNLAITSYQGDEGGMPAYIDISSFVKFENQVQKNIEERLGKLFSIDKSTMSPKMATVAGEGYGSNMGSFFPPLDHGSFSRISVPSLSWVTAHTMRVNYGTWQDTIEKINFENLKEQLEFLFSSFYTFLNTESIFPEIISPWTVTYGKIGQWIEVKIKIAEYKEGWYQPVLNAILAFKPENWFNNLNNPIYTIYVADKSGDVEIYGLSQGINAHIEGYVIDSETGDIIYGPDKGKYAFRHFEEKLPGLFDLSLPRFIDLGYLTIFRCSSIVLFDLEDPYINSRPLVPTTLLVNDMRSHSAPDHYNVAEQYDYSGTSLSIIIVFFQPNVPIEIMLNKEKMPLMLIKDLSTNSYGEQSVVFFPTFKSAKQMYEINDERLRTLIESGFSLTSALDKHNEASILLKEAASFLEQMNYAASYSKVAEALCLVRDNYVVLRSTIESAAYTTPFFSLLMAPFAFIMERMIFEKKGIKRLIMLLIIFSVVAIGLFTLYPGFKLSADPLTVVLVSVIIILSLPILGVIINGYVNLIKGLRRKILGEHYFRLEISKSFLVSFDTSVRYLKRRKIRSFLVLFSLVLILSFIIPFVSFSPSPLIKAIILSEENIPYTGILIKYQKWGAAGGDPFRTGLSSKMIEQIIEMFRENNVNATVAPRAWRFHEGLLYGLYAQQANVRAITLFAGSAQYDVYGILGLTPQESKVSGIEKHIIEGRWFLPTDKYACIITNTIASKLNIYKLPALINLWDLPLTVIGIVSDESLDSFMDLDGEKITPLEFRTPNPNNNIHMPAKETLIIPYSLALSLGMCGYRGLETMTKSITIRIESSELIEPIALVLFERFRLPTYFTVNKKIFYLYEGSVYSPLGLEQKIVPLLLAYLTIFNVLLASIYERKRDIETLALVGLNPLEVSFIFLYEATSIALIGGILGFVGSCVLMHISVFLPLPIQQLDYTSVINALILGMIITISSSIYPSITASKLVTPSAERKWKPMTSPIGDKWEIPLPFIFERDEEIAGILAFAHEAVKDHTSEQSELFFTKKFYFSVKSDIEEPVKALVIEDASISPYDLGVKSDILLVAKKDAKTAKYSFTILLLKKAGKMADWMTFSPRIADLLRKQILLWRGLREEEKKKYIAQGIGLLSG
jgi:Zn-dependent M28 family amino/carboxypeptidase